MKLDLGTKLVFVGCIGMMIISINEAFKVGLVVGLLWLCLVISIIGAAIHMSEEYNGEVR